MILVIHIVCNAFFIGFQYYLHLRSPNFKKSNFILFVSIIVGIAFKIGDSSYFHKSPYGYGDQMAIA
jgi:uncharacterized protein (DUF486 family)